MKLLSQRAEIRYEAELKCVVMGAVRPKGAELSFVRISRDLSPQHGNATESRDAKD